MMTGQLLATRAEREAEAQRLRSVEGLQRREIAERMAVSANTVSSWLSDPGGKKLRARKERYRGRCKHCGKPTHGSSGLLAAPQVCARCLEWSDAEILAAFGRWAAEHGGMPPRAEDWEPAPPGYPGCSVVTVRFGWNNALLLAGFTLRYDRRPETQAAIEAAILRGDPIADIANRYGVGSTAICNRIRSHHGVGVREFRNQHTAHGRGS